MFMLLLTRFILVLIISLVLGGVAPRVYAKTSTENRILVVATVPELGNLFERIGQTDVEVKVLSKGTEDPHFVLPRPGYVNLLHKADLFAQMGLDLEEGWAPALVGQARNPKILLGATGFFDASQYINPLQVSLVAVDRTAGDVHPFGNPHFLIDPINGVIVARAIAHKLTQMQPQRKSNYDEQFQKFRTEIGIRLVGEEIFKKYDFEKLAQLQDQHKLKEFLQKQKDWDNLGGWWGENLPHAPILAVGDHQHWTYFAHRFGVEVIGDLEPRPGITPTTGHMKKLIDQMKAKNVRFILSSPYFDPRYANFVVKNSGATIVPLTHQAGGREGTKDYVQFIDYNARTLAKAVQTAGRKAVDQ